METNPANGLAQEKGSAAFLIELEKQRAIKVETNFYLSLTKETINIISESLRIVLIGYWEKHNNWTGDNVLCRYMFLSVLTSIQLSHKRSMAHFETWSSKT